MNFVGLDIGGTNTKGVVIGESGNVLAEYSQPTVKGSAGVVQGALQVVRHLANQSGLSLTELAGLGIGMPGVIDIAGGTVSHAVNVGIFEQPLALAKILAQELGIPVILENDLNIAAIGAAFLANDDDDALTDLAFLSLGTGVAAGYVLNGVLWRGAGAAGEVGHIPIDPAGPECKCGQRGCLELYCSGSALEAMWPAAGELPGPQVLLRAAAAGDAEAVKRLENYFQSIALAIRIVALTLDPARIVIGGGVVRLGPPLLAGVRHALEELAANSPFLQSLALPARLSMADPDVPVAAIGAAVLARTSVS